jgi:CBS domain-containing protein
MKHRTVSELVRDQVLVELPPEATVREAARLMSERRVGAVLVTREGALAGIFTERDLMTRIAAAGLDPNRVKLSEVMTSKPQTVEVTASTTEALRIMQSGGFRHLPVTRSGKIVAVLSLRDFASSDLMEIERGQDLERAIAEGGRSD